jgi:hypothetical protein
MRMLYVIPANIVLFIVKTILWIVGRVIYVLAMPFQIFCSIIGFFANFFILMTILMMGCQFFKVIYYQPDFPWVVMIIMLIVSALFKYLCDIGDSVVMEIGFSIMEFGSDIEYLPRYRIYVDHSLTEEERMANIERHLETIRKYTHKKEHLANDSESLEK